MQNLLKTTCPQVNRLPWSLTGRLLPNRTEWTSLTEKTSLDLFPSLKIPTEKVHFTIETTLHCQAMMASHRVVLVLHMMIFARETDLPTGPLDLA